MQISKKEEPINFKQLEKKLQGAPFNSRKGKKLLIKLMNEPQRKLSTEEAINYGELQACLLSDDLELRRPTFLAISLAVLRNLNDLDYPTSELAELLSQAIQQQAGKFSTRCMIPYDPIGWQAFCNVLSASSLTSLDFSLRELHTLDQAQWQVFGNALQASRITKLNLYFGYLGRLDQVRWQLFCDAMQASKVSKLNLRSNCLQLLDQAQWQVFGNALRASRITSLNLYTNHLKQFDQLKLQAFCDAIQASNITSLALDEFNPSQMQSFVNLMEDNFHLVLHERPLSMDELPLELKALSDRNCFLQQTMQLAKELINSKSKQNEKDYLIKLDNIITDLGKSLSLLYGKDTQRSNELRAKLQNYLEDLHWKKGCWCRDQAIVRQDTPVDTLNLLNQSRMAWMSLSPKSQHYEEARSQLFQLVYNDFSQDPEAGAHAAFIEALPCLLNEDNQLINLSEENQKVLDHYLFAAAGGKGGLDRKFTSEQRLALLQYVLLLDIKQKCQKKERPANADANFFKTEHSTNLQDLLLQILLKNLSLDSKSLEADSLMNLNDLWAEAYNHLKEVPLDNNARVLIEAINILASPHSSVQLKPKMQINC